MDDHFILRFSALAGLCVEPVARQAQAPDDTVEDTTWKSVRLVVLEGRYSERYVLLAYEFQEPTSEDVPSSSSADPAVKLPPLVLQWFSNDWTIQIYSERYRLVHWHGARGIGDFKVYLGDEDDARKFTRVFMTGRDRESQLAQREADRLQGSQATIFNVVRSGHVQSDNNEA